MKRTGYAIHCLLWVFAASLLLVSGCDSGDDSESANCDISGQNAYVYSLMKTNYLWYDRVPDIDVSLYESPEKLLEDLIFEEVDHWSFIMPEKEFIDYYGSDSYIGLGYGFKYDADGNLRVSFVLEGSPMDRAGITRGDIILEINQVSIPDILAQDLWDSISGPDEIGTSVAFLIRKRNGTEMQIRMEKEEVHIAGVLHQQIFSVNGTSIGYLVYNHFIRSGKEELENVFNTFAKADIKALIVDFRYNSGGFVETARQLASLIVGRRATDSDIFARLSCNDRIPGCDRELPFQGRRDDISLDMVVFITTRATCSASEMVINGLFPFLDVRVVGFDTCGKPVGMKTHHFCDKYILPVEFSISNGDGAGDYFDGIPADCHARDSLSFQFGEPGEESLETAIDLIVTNGCGPAVRSSLVPPSKNDHLNIHEKSCFSHTIFDDYPGR